MVLQRTLKGEINLSGIGVHSGHTAHLTLKPASPYTGILFVRKDLEGSPEIQAHYKNIVNTQMATTLGMGRATVSTVEHVLAALQGARIDNAVIEVNGPEVPIMDGSSQAFFDAIAKVGVEIQPFPMPYLTLKKKVELKVGEKWIVAEPASSLEIHSTIDWDHPAIGYQEYFYREGENSFEEISRARTFGFLREIENLKKMGLAKGGSLDNAIVLDHAFVLNSDGLRYPDEFVKHKVLDALGDFKLAGMPIRAFIRLHRSGHDLHYQFLKEVFKKSDQYEIVDPSYQDQENASTGLQALLARSLVASF